MNRKRSNNIKGHPCALCSCPVDKTALVHNDVLFLTCISFLMFSDPALFLFTDHLYYFSYFCRFFQPRLATFLYVAYSASGSVAFPVIAYGSSSLSASSSVTYPSSIASFRTDGSNVFFYSMFILNIRQYVSTDPGNRQPPADRLSQNHRYTTDPLSHPAGR